MSNLVCMGALLECSFGATPASLVILPQNKVLTGAPAATIMDNKPLLNIPTFGMCRSPANPTVAAATVAALGVLTPMPCVPVTASPWIPGSSTVLIGNVPALNSTSTLLCNWGGLIQIKQPGQITVSVS